MFEQASAKLENPKMKFSYFQLYRTKGGKYPGSVYVSPKDRDSGWYARFETDGSVTFNKGKTLPSGLLEELQSLATNPVEYVASYGKLTDNCCFCSRSLSDDRSLSVGYGKECASHYGLPYPSQSEVNNSNNSTDSADDNNGRHPHWLKRFVYTDRVKATVDKAKCHWLLDAIAKYQTSETVVNNQWHQNLQIWQFRKIGDSKGTLEGTCDGCNVAITQEMEFTDFPLSYIELRLFNGVLFLYYQEK